MHLCKFLDFSDVYDSSKWRFLYVCRGRFRKIKITWVMLDLLSWNSSQIDYQRFRVEWFLHFDFLKSWFFDVLKLLIVIFLQSDIGSKYFFQKSKIPLDLCKNTKLQIIWSTRSVWNRRQQNMIYMWSHGIYLSIGLIRIILSCVCEKKLQIVCVRYICAIKNTRYLILMSTIDK